MSKSWLDYVNVNCYPNIVKKAEDEKYLGLTADIGGKPYLVIGWNGKSHILENEQGNIVNFRGQLDYKPRNTYSAILAASRQFDVIPRGVLSYESKSNSWVSKNGSERIPLERYIEALESVGWSKAAYARLSHEVEEANPDRADDPLVCPKCGSHTLELLNRESSVFHCKTCKEQFHHPVYFNPKAHVLAYEVDDHGKGDYSPGPDDPKKVNHECQSCGHLYSWPEYHKFQLDGECPNCKHQTQMKVQEMEGGEGWKNPKQPHHKSKEEKGWKDEYNFREAADPTFSCDTCAYYHEHHCSMFDASVGEDDTCDEWDRHKTSNKLGFDYTPTTDSMSGHDTNAPIRENPQDYDENVHNQNEVASPAPMAPTDNFPKHNDELGIHTPKGSVHRMISPKGDEILILSDGKGGAMGWAPYQGEMTTEATKWDTSNLLKIKNAIDQGLYRPISKTARRQFTPAEQKELIEEGEDKQARNIHKLDLSNSHYELIEKENTYLWLW